MSKDLFKDMDLSTRARNVLGRMEIYTVEDLLNVSMDELSRQRNIGIKTLEEIKSVIDGLRDDSLIRKMDSEQSGHAKETTLIYQKYVCSIPLTENHIDEMNRHSVQELSLSVRPDRVLKENGIETIGQLAKLKLDDLRIFRSLGNRSIQEIQESFNVWLNENMLMLSDDVDIDDRYLDVVNDCVRFLKPICNITSVNLCRLLKSENKLELLSLDNTEESVVHNFKVVLSLDGLHNQLRAFWITILPACADTADHVESRLKDLNVLDVSILLENGLEWEFILAADKYYVLNRKHFLDAYFEKYGEESNASKIVRMRLNGLKLQEIGDSIGVTRERVRQICVREVHKVDLPIEDAFKEPFQYFAIDKENFVYAFPEIDGHGYEYLHIRYKRGKKELNPESLALYEGLWKERLVLLSEKMRKDFERKSLTSTKIVVRVLIGSSEKSISMDELMSKYYAYLKDNHYPDDSKKYQINDKTLTNHLRNAKSVVYDRSNKVRFCAPDIDALKAGIDFERYRGLVISSELIFKDYRELMDEQDIRDGHELFYVLKNNQGILDENMDVYFRRVPSIVFDHAKEDDQAVRFLKEYSPYDIDDYYAAFEDRFGIRQDSARGNPVISAAVFPYFLNGKYVENVTYISDLDIEAFKERLQEKSIWFIDELEKLFKEVCVHSSDDALNRVAVRKVGYTLNLSYAFDSAYQSATEFLEKEVFSKDILDLRNLDKRLVVLNLFSSNLDKKRLSLEYIEIAPKVYLSRRKLLEVYGLTVEDVVSIQSLITKIDDTYFNGNSIYEKVKDEPLIDKLQGNRWLLTGILHQQPHVYSLRIKGNKILSQTNSLKLSSVCAWLAEQYGRKSISEMTELFNKVFDTDIPSYKLADKIKQDGKWDVVITDSMDEYLDQVASNLDDEDFFVEEFF